MTLRVFCFLLLWTVILNWRSSMTEFVSWRLCLIVFKTFSDRSGIRSHAHVGVPEFPTGISWVWRLRPLAHPAWFTSTYFLLICVLSIEWPFQFRDVICWTICVIYLERFAFKPARRVVFYMSPPGIVFLCTFKLLGYQPPNDVASRLFSFALDCHLELTFQYDRICQLRALPHRVQNVFWQEWESNPRTHSYTRILDWGIFWVCRPRPLGHPAWFKSTYFLLICVISIDCYFQFRDVIC